MIWTCLVWFLAGTAYADPTVLKFWHSMSGQKGRLLGSIVDDFNALPENRGRTEVSLQFIGTYEEGLNKLRTGLMAGRTPHIVQITDIGTQLMIDSRAIVPLQDFIDHDPSFPLNQLLRPIRRYYEVGGRLYSLPFATSNPILYCNADAFKRAGILRPPATFAELEQTARRLTDKASHRTGITWPLHSWFFEQSLARQNQELADHGNGREGRAAKLFLVSPAAIEFVSLWDRMIREGTFANVGRGWDPAEQNFLAGRSAILLTSTSDVFEILHNAPFEVVTAPLPSKDRHGLGGTIVGGNSLWILKDKPEPEREAAYRFVRFMASKAVQKKWHAGTGYFPIRSDAIAELEREGFYKKYPAAETAILQLRASADTPATHGALLGVFSEVREYLESALEAVFSGESDVPSALAYAKRRADRALARYNRGR